MYFCEVYLSESQNIPLILGRNKYIFNPWCVGAFVIKQLEPRVDLFGLCHNSAMQNKEIYDYSCDNKQRPYYLNKYLQSKRNLCDEYSWI